MQFFYGSISTIEIAFKKPQGILATHGKSWAELPGRCGRTEPAIVELIERDPIQNLLKRWQRICSRSLTFVVFAPSVLQDSE